MSNHDSVHDETNPKRNIWGWLGAIVIKALQSGLADQSVYGHILDDILHLASHLSFFFFFFTRHVKLNCNSVADALAKKSRTG